MGQSRVVAELGLYINSFQRRTWDRVDMAIRFIDTLGGHFKILLGRIVINAIARETVGALLVGQSWIVAELGLFERQINKIRYAWVR